MVAAAIRTSAATEHPGRRGLGGQAWRSAGSGPLPQQLDGTPQAGRGGQLRIGRQERHVHRLDKRDVGGVGDGKEDGRASSRERVCQYVTTPVGAGALKK